MLVVNNECDGIAWVWVGYVKVLFHRSVVTVYHFSFAKVPQKSVKRKNGLCLYNSNKS